MFTEWGRGDWGYGWFPIPCYRDSVGVTIVVDPTLNIAVVLAFGKQQARTMGGYMDAAEATFLEGTPYETTVARATDTDALIWIGQHGRRDFCMDAGVGADLLTELRNEGRTLEGIRDALSTVLGAYRGPDGAELNELVNRFRKGEED